MLSRTCCFALQGVEGVPVTVEAYVSGGQFAFTMVGLPDAAVRESRERVYAAMKNNGFTTPSGHVTVNLSPADLRIRRSHRQQLHRHPTLLLTGRHG